MAIPKPVKESIARALGHAIHRRRKDNGLNQAQLAEKSGVHETYVSQLERGKNVPSVDIALALCQALGAELGPFFEEVRDLAETYREE